MNGGDGTQTQIILGARSLWDAEAALPLLHALLDRRGARLVGLFSDEMTTRFAVGPSQRLVTVSGRQVALPTPEVARSLARSESRAFQRRLSAMAARKSWSCDFVEIEGEIVEGICATAAAGDIAILAQRPILRHQGPVLLAGALDAVDPLGPRAFAEALASSLGTGAVILQEGAGPASPALLGAIDRAHASAVVIDGATGQWTLRDLKRLASAARCPVIVFGATRIVG